MHLLLCVKSSYFSGKSYLSKRDWIQYWRDAARLDYDPSVDIHVIKPRNANDADGVGKALAEVTKYAVKPSSYIVPWSLDTSMRAIAVLDKWLDGRRLTAWGGNLKRIAEALKLSDELSGDYIHLDPFDPLEGATAQNNGYGCAVADYIVYRWSVGLNNYQLLGMSTEPSPDAVRAIKHEEHIAAHEAWLGSEMQRYDRAKDIAEAIICDNISERRKDGRDCQQKRSHTSKNQSKA